MKKILYLVTIIFFLISTYLFFDYSSKQEIKNVLGNDNYYVNVSMQTNEGVLDTILKVADQYDVNVQKSVYRLQTDGSFLINIYAQINQSDIFYKDLILKHGIELTVDSPSKSFISTKPTNDKNNIGVISLLDKTNEIRIKKLIDADQENLNGLYYFKGVKNKQEFTKIINDLSENGILMENKQISNQSGITLDMNVLSYIPLILLLVIITTIYNYIMSFKELSVMMLNGFSYKDIVLKKIKSFLLSNMLFVGCIALFTILYHFVTYGAINLHLYITLTLFLIVIGFIVTLLEILCGVIIKAINIAICLRNKKPQKQINIINIVAKFCFGFLILYMGTNSVIKINEFNAQNYNMKTWESSINYAFTMVNANNLSANGSSYEIGSKCKKLYSLLDEKGALMIRLSGYYLAREHIAQNDSMNQPRYITDSIEINNNYLAKFPVYDVNGEKVPPISTTEDVMTILVPEKYMSQKEAVETAYQESFQEIRYFDENLYNEEIGNTINETKQEIRFVYIKDNQKFFTFKPGVSREYNNYVIDPVIIMTNAVNRGTDVYYSMMTSGELLIKISNPQAPFSEIAPYIKEAGLAKNITSTPTVYSRVDQKQYELKQVFRTYIFMLFISLIGYIVITIFITLNYIESNKEINAIKKLFGFSFSKRYLKYYFMSILPILILTPLLLVAYKLFVFSFLVLLVLIGIDMITISLTLYLYEKQSINDVLKGS